MCELSKDEQQGASSQFVNIAGTISKDIYLSNHPDEDDRTLKVETVQ